MISLKLRKNRQVKVGFFFRTAMFKTTMYETTRLENLSIMKIPSNQKFRRHQENLRIDCSKNDIPINKDGNRIRKITCKNKNNSKSITTV